MEFSVDSEAIGSKTNPTPIGSKSNPTPIATEANPIPVNMDSKIVSKRTRSVSSNVWNYFEKFIDNDGKERAQCKGCGNSYAAGGNNYGTSTLQRHLGKCKHVPKLVDTEVGKLILDHYCKIKK
ncbi:Zinc finger, BED-type [Sesbania bispinosa]|nr:Zinc finger, BED-type [Sesbania bispinosa]